VTDTSLLLTKVICFSSQYDVSVRYEWGRSGIRTHSRVRSKAEKLAPVASLVSVHHLRPRAGAGWPSVSLKWMGGVSCFCAAWYFGALAL